MASEKSFSPPQPDDRTFKTQQAFLDSLTPVPLDSVPENQRKCPHCFKFFGESDPGLDNAEEPVRFPCNHVFGEKCMKGCEKTFTKGLFAMAQPTTVELIPLSFKEGSAGDELGRRLKALMDSKDAPPQEVFANMLTDLKHFNKDHLGRFREMLGDQWCSRLVRLLLEGNNWNHNRVIILENGFVLDLPFVLPQLPRSHTQAFVPPYNALGSGLPPLVPPPGLPLFGPNPVLNTPPEIGSFNSSASDLDTIKDSTESESVLQGEHDDDDEVTDGDGCHVDSDLKELVTSLDKPTHETKHQQAFTQEVPQQQAPKQQAPKQEAPKQEAPKQEVPKQEAPKQEVPKQEAPKQEVPKQEAPKQEAPKQEMLQQQGSQQQVTQQQAVSPPSNPPDPIPSPAQLHAAASAAYQKAKAQQEEFRENLQKTYYNMIAHALVKVYNAYMKHLSTVKCSPAAKRVKLTPLPGADTSCYYHQSLYCKPVSLKAVVHKRSLGATWYEVQEPNLNPHVHDYSDDSSNDTEEEDDFLSEPAESASKKSLSQKTFFLERKLCFKCCNEDSVFTTVPSYATWQIYKGIVNDCPLCRRVLFVPGSEARLLQCKAQA